MFVFLNIFLFIAKSFVFCISNFLICIPGLQKVVWVFIISIIFISKEQPGILGMEGNQNN